MAVGVAAGFPQLSGTVIPVPIWSKKLLVKFYAATIFNEFANTDYEGEIANMGDKVQIRTTPSLTIKKYKKGQALETENPVPDLTELTIDQANYWSATVDDIDAFQSDYDFMSDWSEDASEQMKIFIDTEILGDVYASAHASNSGATAGVKSGSINLGATGSPLGLTKLNILDFLVDIGTVMDEQNVPESDRKVALPPWACGLIKKSDLKDASLAGDGTSIMRNGRVGMIDRLEVYCSNLLATTVDGAQTATEVIACQRHAISFASQIVKSETLRAESTFGDIVRGLQVYGYDVLKPEALVHAHVYKA